MNNDAENEAFEKWWKWRCETKWRQYVTGMGDAPEPMPTSYDSEFKMPAWAAWLASARRRAEHQSEMDQP